MQIALLVLAVVAPLTAAFAPTCLYLPFVPYLPCLGNTMPPKKPPTPPLKPFYDTTEGGTPWEIALDECGRGPLFGRVYAAAVVLPRDSDGGTGAFDVSLMRDSKKIHSRKKMAELAAYIRQHAVATSVRYQEADVVDRVNILQADMMCMHDCIRDVLTQLQVSTPTAQAGLFQGRYRDVSILVDGNYFKPFSVFDEVTDSMYTIPYTTVEQGDNTYASIAAASILAKYERDLYILNLCEQYPELKARYALDKNMGYGTPAHLSGIVEHGITQWHRKTFGRCRDVRTSDL